MARILSIDYGGKRTGIAVTDPLQLIATGLTTIETRNFIPFLRDYCSREPVEKFIIGMPLNMDDTPTHATPLVEQALRQLQKHFPKIPVETVDERYTSKMAKDAMLQMGLRKKQRRDKKLVDEIAATILLQEYLERRG
ncbi:MAG TPA: Holliday junction resolvase RuvX [Lacibacter sp.]|nr:Holliday junction resolvase RuvX [Lacibacter sp.]HMO89341.1 Holliday junction resolvase RuvX [Lacibacter sp.]HMP86847.1 Holliday junction resolvase RuvX [Lacibacter sp.]